MSHTRTPRFRLDTFRLPIAGLLFFAAQGFVHAATPDWSAPATLGTSSLYYLYDNNVSVAVSANPLAQSVAVWVEPSTMTVKYAMRRNGKWAAGKTLYKANATAAETLTDPQVVMDAYGTATAVWASSKQGPMKYCSSGLRVYRCPDTISYAKVATLAPDALVWSKANLSAKGFSVTDAQVGVDQSGNAVALWTYRATATSVPTLQSISRSTGVWSQPTSIYAGTSISLPRLSVGPSGNAVAVWEEKLADNPDTPYAIRASSLPAGTTTWGMPETVTTQATSAAYLGAAVGGNGQTAIVWDNSYGAQWARGAAGVWTAPQALVSAADRTYSGTGPYAAYGPRIATDIAGDFLVTWLESDISTGESTIEAEYSAATGASSHMSWPTGAAVPPNVALSADGSGGMIAWLDQNDYNTYAASFNPASLAWGQPLLLSKGTAQYSAVWGTGVSLACGPNQSASAVWLSVSGTNYQVKFLGSTY